MDVNKAILGRHSCRAFKSDQIPKAIIEELLSLASRAPSYMNTQPWEIAVVTGHKLAEINQNRAEFAAANTESHADVSLPSPWPDVHQERARRFNNQRRAVLAEAGQDSEKEWGLFNAQFFGAPCGLFLFIDRALGEWSVFDLGLFTETLVLAAEDRGIGTCVEASVVRYPDYLRQVLGIPDNRRCIIGIALGYPDTEAPINKWRSDRTDVTQLTTWHS